MWEKVNKKFQKYPAKLRVIEKMINLGIRVDKNENIYIGDLKIGDTALAKTADVDRRVIKSTVKLILEDKELSLIFKNIVPAGALLKNIAKFLNLGVIEIEGTQEGKGILASVSQLISEKDIKIRQAYAGDTEMNESPKLTIITENKVPGEIINEFLKINGVSKVSIY